MANLKQDLLNDLGNEKYYAELELARLAADPAMVYKDKVVEMSDLLKGIAETDLATQLVGKYFQDPVAAPEGEPQGNAPVPEQPAPAPAQPAAPKPHDGQTHGE